MDTPVCPCQKHKGYDKLEPGMIVDVYIQQDNGVHKFEGKATLLRQLRTFFAAVPFPIVEHCPICKQTTNNIKERWVVEPPADPLRTGGDTCVRSIHKFHSYGTPHVRDVMDMENEDVEEKEDFWENKEYEDYD